MQRYQFKTAATEEDLWRYFKFNFQVVAKRRRSMEQTQDT